MLPVSGCSDAACHNKDTLPQSQAPQLTRISFGVQIALANEESIEYAQVLFVLLPGAFGVACVVRQFVAKKRVTMTTLPRLFEHEDIYEEEELWEPRPDNNSRFAYC